MSMRMDNESCDLCGDALEDGQIGRCAPCTESNRNARAQRNAANLLREAVIAQAALNRAMLELYDGVGVRPGYESAAHVAGHVRMLTALLPDPRDVTALHADELAAAVARWTDDFGDAK